MAERVSIRVLILGRVQGVGFRAWMQHRAMALGVSGWTRNHAGGQVEALLSGTPEAVAAMLAACREGPRLAEVTEVQDLGPADPLQGPFTIRADSDN